MQQRVERRPRGTHDARERAVARVEEGDGRHGNVGRLEARQAHDAAARAPRRGPVPLQRADAVREELVLERRRPLRRRRRHQWCAVVRRVHAADITQRGRDDDVAQRRGHRLEVVVVARRVVKAEGLDADHEALLGPRVLERALDRGLGGPGALVAAHCGTTAVRQRALLGAFCSAVDLIT